MASSQQPNFGALTPWSTIGDYNNMRFVIDQAILQIQTAIPVRVISCTNDGELMPVGSVDVQILINQLDGNGNAVPHGILSNLPYSRIQGGSNAIIIDPVAGDIGFALFASRDISLIKSTKAQANPGSRRHHNFADGMFVAATLNGTPSQYLRFSDDGLEIISPNAVTVDAPTITLGAETKPAMNRETYDWLMTSLIPALTSHGIMVPAMPVAAIALTTKVTVE